MEQFTSRERSVMSAVAAAQSSLRDYAASEWPRLNHKGRLAKLCRLLPTWTDRRVRAVYNAEQGVSLRADEQEAVQRLTATEEATNALRQSQAEYRDLEARIARIEALFQHGDEEFGRPQVDAYRAAALGQGQGFQGRGEGNGPARFAPTEQREE